VARHREFQHVDLIVATEDAQANAPESLSALIMSIQWLVIAPLPNEAASPATVSTVTVSATAAAALVRLVRRSGWPGSG
jgi:hypothetical protein